MKKRCIAFVAGRSAGHIVPALALAAQEKKTYLNTQVIFFASNTQLDRNILENSNVVNDTFFLPLANIPAQAWRFIPYFFQLCYVFCASFSQLYTHKPYSLVSTGGYISIPVCLAAWCLRIPVRLYEVNAVPGKATRKLAYLATNICCTFKSALAYFPNKKTQLGSYPLLITHNNAISSADIPGFNPTHKTVLVLGGSQGSTFINQFMMDYIKTHPRNIQIIHQTGAQDFQTCKAFYDQHRDIPSYVFAYEKDIHRYYQIADIIIARAGAGTLFEIVHFNKKALIIPLETQINDHQVYNAQEMARRYPNLITVWRQKDITFDSANYQVFSLIQRYSN